MKFIHTSDWHLAYRQYGYLQRELDYYEAVYNLGQRIVKTKGIDAVIVAGDIFDNPRPSAVAVQQVSAFVNTVRAAGIAVLGIDGNHDACNGDWLRVCGITPLADATQTIAGIRVRGINYSRPTVFYEAVDKLVADGEKIDVLVIHQALGEFADFIAREITALELVPRLQKLGVRYVAMGDIHDYKESVIGGIRFVYSGSLECMSTSEKYDKSVSVVDITGTTLTTQFEFTPIRQTVEVHLRTEADLNNLLSLAAGHPGTKTPLLLVRSYEDKDLGKRAEALLRGRDIMFRITQAYTASGQNVSEKLVSGGLERKGMVIRLTETIEAFFATGSDEHQLITQMLGTPENVEQIVSEYWKTKGVTQP